MATRPPKLRPEIRVAATAAAQPAMIGLGLSVRLCGHSVPSVSDRRAGFSV